MINLWAIFLTGLITGGLSCLAVQGGLLAATIAQQEGKNNVLPILAFLVAKLIAYTAFGFLLGWFGSLFQLSLSVQVIMQFAVAIFMLGTAMNILQVHPMFRYFAIQPPRFITKLVRNQAKSKNIFAPALLGAFTVFIPCGTTQAMMALAIGSGNPVLGALILFAFVLGTSPLFFILGYSASKLGENMHKNFMKIAAFTLIVLAIFNLNNALALTGSPLTFENFIQQDQKISDQAPTKGEINILVEKYGYIPNAVTVKAGQEVTFNIENKEAYTCAAAFTIPYFNYQKVIDVGKTETFTLKMPDEPTQIPFMCSMGMYRGVINVVK